MCFAATLQVGVCVLHGKDNKTDKALSFQKKAYLTGISDLLFHLMKISFHNFNTAGQRVSAARLYALK